MPMTNNEKQKAWRDRKMAAKRERRMALMIVVDMINDTNVRCRPELTKDNITFHWTGDQFHYDNLEVYCQEHGFSFAVVMHDFQQRELARILDKNGLKLAGPPKWIPTTEEKAEFLASRNASNHDVE